MAFNSPRLFEMNQLYQKEVIILKNYLAIKHFNNHQVRIVRYDNKFYFLAKDVISILGYGNNSRHTLTKFVDKEDRRTLTWRACAKTALANLWNKNDYSNKKFVNESGVYALIFGSKLPSAKRFKHWVTSKVLPSIRKNGSYSMKRPVEPSYMIADPIRRAKRWIQEEKHTRHLAQENKDHQKLERVFRSTKTNVPIGQVAKVISNTGHFIGRNKFFKWLRHQHILISRGRQYNVPYQNYIEMGLFKVTEKVISDANDILATTVLVTPKGQQYLVKRYLKWVKRMN